METKLKIVKQIHERLASLENFREEAKDYPITVTMIDIEMKALRLKLQDVINSPCPVLNGGAN